MTVIIGARTKKVIYVDEKIVIVWFAQGPKTISQNLKVIHIGNIEMRITAYWM